MERRRSSRLRRITSAEREKHMEVEEREREREKG